MKKMKISKLDAVKRQLETVIRLYFSDGDPVSIHTLTAAAYNVARDLNEKYGGPPLLMKDQFMDWVKKGHEKEVRKKINEAENFFKHADRDHEETIDFNLDQSEFLILEACKVYYKLSGDFPPLFRVFQSWFIANNPKMFNFPEEQERVIALGRQDIINLGRGGYFKFALPGIMKIGT
jgi:hypothetical protein